MVRWETLLRGLVVGNALLMLAIFIWMRSGGIRLAASQSEIETASVTVVDAPSKVASPMQSWDGPSLNFHESASTDMPRVISFAKSTTLISPADSERFTQNSRRRSDAFGSLPDDVDIPVASVANRTIQVTSDDIELFSQKSTEPIPTNVLQIPSDSVDTRNLLMTDHVPTLFRSIPSVLDSLRSTHPNGLVIVEPPKTTYPEVISSKSGGVVSYGTISEILETPFFFGNSFQGANSVVPSRR